MFVWVFAVPISEGGEGKHVDNVPGTIPCIKEVYVFREAKNPITHVLRIGGLDVSNFAIRITDRGILNQ